MPIAFAQAHAYMCVLCGCLRTKVGNIMRQKSAHARTHTHTHREGDTQNKVGSGSVNAHLTTCQIAAHSCISARAQHELRLKM